MVTIWTNRKLIDLKVMCASRKCGIAIILRMQHVRYTLVEPSSDRSKLYRSIHHRQMNWVEAAHVRYRKTRTFTSAFVNFSRLSICKAYGTVSKQVSNICLYLTNATRST